MSTPFEKAKSLAEQGKYKEAWEFLYGKKNPSLTLHKNTHYGKYAKCKTHWEKLGCRMMTWADFYILLDTLTKEELDSLRNSMLSGLWGSEVVYTDMMVSVDGRPPIACPEYRGVPIMDVHEAVPQYFFNTKDGKDIIVAKLSEFSGLNPDVICFWTPKMNFRKDYPRHASWLGCNFSDFNLVADNFLVNCGASRGVLSSETR